MSRTIVEMLGVLSSAISAVGYDAATRQLKVRFVEGPTYDFCGVPASVFDGFLKARSKGAYFNEHIRDRYPC